MAKSNTPPSGKHMPVEPAVDAGYNKTKMPDKESPNSCEAFDGSSAIVPLNSKGYMDGSRGT